MLLNLALIALSDKRHSHIKSHLLSVKNIWRLQNFQKKVIPFLFCCFVPRPTKLSVSLDEPRHRLPGSRSYLDRQRHGNASHCSEIPFWFCATLTNVETTPITFCMNDCRTLEVVTVTTSWNFSCRMWNLNSIAMYIGTDLRISCFNFFFYDNAKIWSKE